MRVAVLCPGRGSYTERSLGSLEPGHAWVRRAEELRAESGLSSLVELDSAARFSAGRHLAPENAAPLIWLATQLDAAAALREHRAVCVAGNSMGWYSALPVAGVLSFDDGFRLAQEMALIQQAWQQRSGGGQVLWPLVGEDWRPDPARAAALREALERARGEAFPSIELGGYAVLAGTERGIAELLAALPPVKLGATAYPFRLAQHGPYHTPLLAEVAAEARSRLSGLEFRSPKIPLIDGRGRRHAPGSADPEALREYTLGAQILEPFHFTASVRVALREWAPDRLLLPGPGNTLGGVCGQILAAEGWRGIHSHADFDRIQAGPEPVVVSMRR